MILFLVLIAIVELLVILGLANEQQNLRSELRRTKCVLRNLQRDDSRFIDQLLERGRREVERLEEHYRRNLPARERPSGERHK